MFHVWDQNSLYSCGQMVEIWPISSNFPSWWYSQVLKTQKFSRWPCYLQPFFCTAPSWVSSCHSDTDKHWQACRLPLGVSVASLAPPLTITVWVLCVGSRLLVISQTGPCLTARIPWSLQTDTKEQNTALLPQPNQAKGPNYQIKILQAFSSRTYFSLLTLGH